MMGLSGLSRAMERRRKLSLYRTVRASLESLSEADLADMGLKRYQLGAAARRQAFGHR